MVQFLIPMFAGLGVISIIIGAADISRACNPVVAYFGAVEFLGGMALLIAATLLWLLATGPNS